MMSYNIWLNLFTGKTVINLYGDACAFCSILTKGVFNFS